MAAQNLTPDHVAYSFDKLTGIIADTDAQSLQTILDRLESAQKINQRERNMVVMGQAIFKSDLDDDEYSAWADQIGALMVAAQTRREFRFAEWLDAIAETCYRCPNVSA